MIKLLIIMIVIFLTSGCYDANEPNDIAYVIALGIDKAEEDDLYEYTIQFAKTTQISGGSSEEGGKEGSSIVDEINVKAPTIYSGINIANQVVSKSFTLAHTKLIVFSDEIAKDGVKDLLDTFGRNSDIRPNIYLAVSKGKSKDYLDEVKPVVEVNPANYYRLIYESEHGGYVPKMILKDFYFQLDNHDKQNILPLAGVNQENKKENEEKEQSSGGDSGSGTNSDSGGGNQSSGENSGSEEDEKKKVKTNKSGFDYLAKEYVAGKMDVDKQNASEVIGMAVFSGDRMVGTMDNIESLIYNMLVGEFDFSYTAFYNKDYPKVPLTIALEQKRKPKIKVDTKTDKPKIDITLFLEGQLISEAIDYPVEDKIEEVEGEIEKETKKKVEKFLKKTIKMNTDIVGFGQYAKKKFLTYNDYNGYEWTQKYADAEFDVKVDFELERIGFIDLSERGER